MIIVYGIICLILGSLFGCLTIWLIAHLNDDRVFLTMWSALVTMLLFHLSRRLIDDSIKE